jgi:hypothetical protein
MLKKTLTLVASTAIMLGGTAIIAPAAQADTPGCVTRAEYRSVHKGMTKAKIARVFDTAGHRMAFATSGGYTSEIRNYKTCSPYSVVSIGYGNGKLDAKSAVWVS